MNPHRNVYANPLERAYAVSRPPETVDWDLL